MPLHHHHLCPFHSNSPIIIIYLTRWSGSKTSNGMQKASKWPDFRFTGSHTLVTCVSYICENMYLTRCDKKIPFQIVFWSFFSVSLGHDANHGIRDCYVFDDVFHSNYLGSSDFKYVVYMSVCQCFCVSMPNSCRTLYAL